MEDLISESQKESWRKEYIGIEYLSHLNNEDLKDRLNDILLNLLSFSSNGSISINYSGQMSGLIQKLMHLEKEFSNREVCLNISDEIEKYTSRYKKVFRAMELKINNDLLNGSYLVIFGKKIHFEQTMKSGTIQIKPASEYDNTDFIAAVRDNELSEAVSLPKGTKIRRKLANGKFKDIDGVKNISISKNYQSDYYMYCMSSSYQPRLFDDFKADSFILVHDIPTFLDKIVSYLKLNFPDYLIDSKNVKYYDPFFPSVLLEIPFNKHFRYWYQSEFRIVFKPKIAIKKLDIIYPEIGSLIDCCKLIEL